MKKLFVMIALAATTAVQAGEVNDSIVVSNPQTVTIVKNDSLQKVNIIGMQGDSDFRYTSEVPIDQKKMKQQKVKDALETETGKWVLDLGVGCNIASNNKADFGFAPFKSKEIFFGLRYCYTPKNKLQTYSIGLWFDWRDYCTPKYNSMYKNEDGIVVSSPYPENFGDTRSLIRVFSLSVPVLFTQKFGHKSKVKFSLGPVVNFNVRGRINNEWTDGDVEHESSTKSIGQRPVTVDFMGMLQYSGIGIYCKYSPMSVLKKTSANGVENPQFQSLTFGICF